ncbi:MAG: hypothetical protein ACK4M3_08055, partial [Pyrobaculum sp.]
MINVTVLPALLNYTICVKNVGNDTGVVKIEGMEYTLAPGQEAAAGGSMKVSHAGVFEISAKISTGEVVNTTQKEVRVYYLTPVFRTKAINLTVYRLPANITVSIEVENVGNYTGHIAGVEIPPGGAVEINKTIYLEAAGSYEIRLGNLSVPVVVTYLTPNFVWRVGGVTEVEALPGEEAQAWLWLKNVGNATARLRIDGVEAVLRPGEERNFTKSFRITKAGVYTTEFKAEGDLNATFKHSLRAKVIRVVAELVLWEPDLDRAWPQANGTSSMALTVSQKSVVAKWGYLLNTNASGRSVTLVVEDPGG